MTKLLSLSCLAICLLSPAARAADNYAGKYESPKLSVEIIPDGDAYAGQIHLGQQAFPLKAREAGGHLQGAFNSQGHDYDFSASLQAEGLTLVTAGTTYTLKKVSAPVNPLAGPANPLARPQAAGPLAEYLVVASTDSGKALSVQKAKATSVQAALEATFPDLAKYFDGRPTITNAFEDTRDHKSGGASFTAKLNGQPVKGLVSCRIGEKGAAVALVYCNANAPAEEWNKLATPSLEARPTDAPAAQEIKLQEYKFSDGTGTMGLAPGWKTNATSCLHGITIEGPGDQTLTIGFSVSVVTPDSTAVQMQRQLEAQARQMGFAPPPPLQLLVAPFTGPADAMNNLVPQLSRVSQANRGPAIKIDKLTEMQKVKPNLPNGTAALLTYGVTRITANEQKHYRALAQVETDPVGEGAWMFYSVELAAPDKTFDTDVPVMLAMAGSLKGNDAVIEQKTRDAINEQNRRFAIMQQAHRDQMDSYDRQNKAWERRQTQQARTNADFDEVIRGYRTVENTSTGERTSVNLGNVDKIVDTLNQYDPGRYKQIPLRDEMYPLTPER